jgi:hypothetical protein
MKKSIILGVILCVFVLVALPSINALEGDTLIGKEKANNLKKTKLAELFSIAKELETNENPKMFYSSFLLVASVALTVIIAALIYIYVSGMIGPDSIETPSISFVKDEATDKLIVASADADVLWSDIEIQGQCNTAGLSGYVTAGDQITECNGEIRIIHIPSNAVLGIFNFN